MMSESRQDSCTSSLEKYGVGSCGPRGFYGTIGNRYLFHIVYAVGIILLCS